MIINAKRGGNLKNGFRPLNFLDGSVIVKIILT